MFSIQYPSIFCHLRQFAYGLQPVRLPPDNRMILIIKMSQEAILTARLNQQIKIYLIPDVRDESCSHGFITAFFDNHDEPIVLFTPLYSGDAMLTDLTEVLDQDGFDLYFFDEHDREMMGVRARTADVERFQATMRNARFPTLDMEEVPSTYEAMRTWFGLRTAQDDARAFTVQFDVTLYPDDFLFIDLRDEAYDFQGAHDTPSMTSLEREEPGGVQERGIARLLRRAFLGDSIFLNPVRDDSGTELTDVLCVTNDVLLLIQAKDSPNTEMSLRRSIDRKRSVVRAHIKKGAQQLRGALSYLQPRDEIVLLTPYGPRTVPIAGRAICGLVVVREMFDDDYEACSAPVLAVAQGWGAPCVLLDYTALHVMTLHLSTPIRLFNGLHRLFDVALERGEYPKPRFIGAPPRGAAASSE
jgi:hypothetical protein